MLNVHASGGFTMMKEAKTALQSAAKNLRIPRPKIIGVTVLTSMDDAELKRMGIEIPVFDLTRNLALLAKEAGLDGVVASGQEIEMIRDLCGRDFVIVTPGVRIEDKKDDQKRTITPQEALLKGASYIVLGRALRDSKNPKEVLDRIYADVKHAPHL
jgi:orotidine-5'-phosphate decarboxylase